MPVFVQAGYVFFKIQPLLDRPVVWPFASSQLFFEIFTKHALSLVLERPFGSEIIYNSLLLCLFRVKGEVMIIDAVAGAVPGSFMQIINEHFREHFYAAYGKTQRPFPGYKPGNYYRVRSCDNPPSYGFCY